MPVHNSQFLDDAGRPSSQALALAGPVLQVEVTIPTALAEYLQGLSEPLPQPIVGIALVDTGASRSCVDQRVIEQLGVKPLGLATMGTAGGPVRQPLYPAKFRLPVQRMEFEFAEVVGVNLQGQIVGGRPLVALIGREVLSRCLFIYNGVQGAWTLAI